MSTKKRKGFHAASVEKSPRLQLTQDELKRHVEYDPSTGIMKKLCSGRICRGENTKGYLRTWINKRIYYVHRLAWLYVYGELPISDIDHINHNKEDNRIENLRSVSRKENMRNASLRSDNNSGFHGVFWARRDNVWRASICIDGINIHLGSFRDKDDAIMAREDAEKEHKFHKNHGIVL